MLGMTLRTLVNIYEVNCQKSYHYKKISKIALKLNLGNTLILGMVKNYKISVFIEKILE